MLQARGGAGARRLWPGAQSFAFRLLWLSIGCSSQKSSWVLHAYMHHELLHGGSASKCPRLAALPLGAREAQQLSLFGIRSLLTSVHTPSARTSIAGCAVGALPTLDALWVLGAGVPGAGHAHRRARGHQAAQPGEDPRREPAGVPGRSGVHVTIRCRKAAVVCRAPFVGRGGTTTPVTGCAAASRCADTAARLLRASALHQLSWRFVVLSRSVQLFNCRAS